MSKTQQQQGYVNPPYPQQQGYSNSPYPQQPGDHGYGTAQAPPSYAEATQPTVGYSDGYKHDDVEAGAANNEGFTTRRLDDRTLRRAFIRKVYLILFSQLLVTLTFVLVFSQIPSVRKWIQAHSWMYWISYGVFLVTYIVIVCIDSVRRKFPGNFIALGIFTFALSYMAGTISAFYNTNAVLICLAITAVVCIGITIFAIQTKIDFTLCSGLLFALVLVLILFSLSMFITFMVTRDRFTYYVMHTVYGGLAALVFSLFLVFDTQRVVGGRKYELSEEEYVFGALQIYIDVVYLFLIILGFSRSN